MLTESFILLILVVVFCYFTLRSGRQGMVLLMLPLLVVPGANVMGFALAPQLDKLSPLLGPEHWRILFVLGRWLSPWGWWGESPATSSKRA